MKSSDFNFLLLYESQNIKIAGLRSVCSNTAHIKLF